MPDALAARRLARRSRDGGRRAAFTRRLWARALTSAALAGVFCFYVGMPGAAYAAGAAANTPTVSTEANAKGAHPSVPVPQTPAPPRAALPGFNPPPATPGTTASGPVRLQPAHMPFYVATRGTTTLYVLGTLHVGDPADYPAAQPFRPPIMGALAASPTLALELSPDELLVSQDDVSKYGVCRRDCLPGLLPEPLWRKLAFRLRGNPAALDEIKKTRPWLASLLVETYDSLSAGLQTEYGTEAQLQNVYLRTRGKIVGLETLPQQMRAFTGLSLAQQREMLAQDLVQTPAQNVEDVRTLHRLWRVGDADAIAAWEAAKTEKLARDKRVSDSIDDRIVYARNRRFVSRMLLIAAPNKPVFVAIGALHLGGRKGVLQLLRQHGFVVEAG
ncbi:TraB/GumN family protein [Paraburkholderia phenoliruptrix]|uniref:TraB/GumN family protein n=1 Tax=Paraburkholderia phenoliruptrix TaxID=252970 RepID=UPI002869E3B2|nr:TraB/GumN family protein [Paraburkholderia phenoliruptrix]WMY08388.1 TraB/GumN family protein [Paraburkholderia phenoliruptrix]